MKSNKLPLDVITSWLKDPDCDVRCAAMNACQGKDVPIIREFEPPKRVYKKCIGGVIVEARIPKKANVVGGIGKKCRASEAYITNVFGCIAGSKYGISFYDNSIVYGIGSKIKITDFDMSHETCSTGFHFFCTRREAEDYDFEVVRL